MTPVDQWVIGALEACVGQGLKRADLHIIFVRNINLFARLHVVDKSFGIVWPDRDIIKLWEFTVELDTTEKW